MTHYYHKHVQIAAGLTLLFTLALWVWSPSLSGQIVVLLVFSGFIGLPHGLTDLALLKRAGERLLPHTINAPPAFAAGFLMYLAIMSLFFLAWILAPLLALLVFLGISGLHFGTQDGKAYQLPHWQSTHCHLTRWRFWLFAFMRGVMVILFPLLLHTQTAEIFNTMIGFNFFYTPTLGTATIIALALTFLLPLLLIKRKDAFGEQFLLMLAYVMLPPLMSFTLYFCLWHTPRHYIEEREVIQKFVLGKISLLKLAVMLAFFVGGTFVGFLSLAPPYGQQTAAFFFILVSSLTAAHVIFTLVIGGPKK